MFFVLEFFINLWEVLLFLGYVLSWIVDYICYLNSEKEVLD